MIDTTALLADANAHRLVLQGTLVPVTGDLFQPAGFPDIGHVIYDAPRPVMVEKGEGKDKKLVQAKDALGNLQWSKEKVCVVDSSASMANHLEAVSLASKETLELHPDIEGMPFVQCVTGEKAEDGKLTKSELVVSTLSEGHRLASSYFLDDKSKLVEGEKVSEKNFGTVLREAFGIRDLGKKTHPLPGDWWNVFRTIFRYDPNSLVHGILFPAMGIKLSRVLTAHHEAFGADRVGLSGVKFDKLGKTTSGQPIFSVDKETAREIHATFVIDLSLIRSFGRDVTKKEGEAKKEFLGLTDDQKRFLLELALWKIGRLLSSPHRFRSGCDLKCSKLVQVGGESSNGLDPAVLGAGLKDLVVKGDSLWQEKNEKGVLVAVQKEKRITQVYWPSEELFKAGKDDDKDPADADDAVSTDDDN